MDRIYLLIRIQRRMSPNLGAAPVRAGTDETAKLAGRGPSWTVVDRRRLVCRDTHKHRGVPPAPAHGRAQRCPRPPCTRFEERLPWLGCGMSPIAAGSRARQRAPRSAVAWRARRTTRSMPALFSPDRSPFVSRMYEARRIQSNIVQDDVLGLQAAIIASLIDCPINSSIARSLSPSIL